VFAAIEMLDFHYPTTDDRTLILSRYTELNADQKAVVKQLTLELPRSWRGPPSSARSGSSLNTIAAEALGQTGPRHHFSLSAMPVRAGRGTAPVDSSPRPPLV